MKILIDVIMVLIFIVSSIGAIVRLLNYVTRWREQGELKKLYMVSIVILIAVILLLHLISRF
jgi:hypothetical protein